MESFFLSALVTELNESVAGRVAAKVFLKGSELFIDFRLPDRRALVVRADPSSPGLYLSGKAQTLSESDVNNSHSFVALLRKRVVGARLVSVEKQTWDRVVR